MNSTFSFMTIAPSMGSHANKSFHIGNMRNICHGRRPPRPASRRPHTTIGRGKVNRSPDGALARAPAGGMKND
jgi:hypothetical protein